MNSTLPPTIFEAKEVKVNGINIHYLSAGAGEKNLLLLHGSAVDSAMLTYGPSIPLFAQTHRILAPDWPGYGKSERPEAAYSTQYYVDFLAAFTETLRLERTSVIAFSMGGAIALGFALAYPERVDKLVLVNSYGLGNRVHIPLLPYAALKTPKLEKTVWRGLSFSRSFLRFCLSRFVFGDPSKVTDELVNEVASQVIIKDNERAFMYWLRGEIGVRRLYTDYSARLKDLQAPTLLLHGSRDIIIPAKRSKAAARVIPNARLEIVRRCGHWTPREEPEIFRQEVMRFLEE